jgi:hypothetical protein
VVAIPGANVDFNSAAVTFLSDAAFERDTTGQGGVPISAESIAGFGDGAYQVVGPHIELLFVRMGEYRVAFEVSAGRGMVLVSEEAIARIVVPRLPT